jgi:hypothetical protein
LAADLPNGGLAWYYPKHYAVARMLGHRLKYSSISQGTILSGLVAMAQENPHIPMDLARRAYLAMEFPFEQGGVNLDGRAVMEMPSFAGPPEIILNGWIDALLHIRDYAEASGDGGASVFFKQNVAFLAEVLPNFDARDASISRYSDVSPHRVKVTLASPDDADTLRVLYVPKIEGLQPVLVPLERTADPENFSNYDNQILRQNGREAIVWLSCSQLYDTVVLADSTSMSLTMHTGEVVRTQSAPGRTGPEISIESETFEGPTRSITLGPQDGLICGYPTNFSKGGVENYYHVYHIVGLMLLATGRDVTPEQSAILVEWALRWYEDMEHIQETEGLVFHDPQDVLMRTSANQIDGQYEDFQSLLADAKALLALL